MRPIDADALKEKAWDADTRCGYVQVVDVGDIDDAPTIEPERKKGKWIEYNATGKKQWMCSECCAEEKNPKVARFCYWCGADMRGEQE